MTITRNPRIYGNRLGLTLDGRDYWADVSKYECAPDQADADALTFADAASGNTSVWKLKGSAIQSTAAGSFWDMVWKNAGTTVPFILAPHGNLTASSAQPHFTGTVKIGAKPPISSEAGDAKGSVFEFEWDITGEPERVETGSTLGAGAMDEV